MNPPANPQIEAGVIGACLATPDVIGLIATSGVEPSHFYVAAHQLLFKAATDAFYDGHPLDPITMGELHAKQLMKMWGCDETRAVARVAEMAADASAAPEEHAKLVKRDADYRALLRVCEDAQKAIEGETHGPEHIAGIISQKATKVATAAIMDRELVSFADSGRQFVNDARQAVEAKRQGLELGAYFGINAIDRFTRGLQPTELLIGAGEPGVGKSAVWWRAGLSFAERQAKRPQSRQVGTLVLSLEMGSQPSNMRFASMLTGVDSVEVREGTVKQPDLDRIISEWRARQDLPLWMSYAPSLRASQLRAIVSEGVRRHNVGLVIIDHFKYFKLDDRPNSRVEEEGDKAEFLKEQIAKDLNVAVVCLAHTRKPDPQSNGRPRLSDLRGSGDISAHADFVSFIYRPYLYASQREIEKGTVSETDAEMIWSKNRHGISGSGMFLFDPQRMFIV